MSDTSTTTIKKEDLKQYQRPIEDILLWFDGYCAGSENCPLIRERHELLNLLFEITKENNPKDQWIP